MARLINISLLQIVYLFSLQNGKRQYIKEKKEVQVGIDKKNQPFGLAYF
jgi:hypothetical protein